MNSKIAVIGFGNIAKAIITPLLDKKLINPKDVFCLVNSNTGDILTAARTAYGQAVSDYNLNINLLTGEKTTERNVPAYIIWE